MSPIMHSSNIVTLFVAVLISISASIAHSSGNNQHNNISRKFSAKQPEISRIEGMNAGDRACYVELVNSQGQKQRDFADFEVCEKTNLIGKLVQITRKKSKIMSAACEGREDCTLTDTVNLIVGVKEIR